MGTLVTAAAKENTKPNYTVETVAFGSVAVADGELAVFVGNAIPSAETWAAPGLQKALQGIREAHWPDPASLSVINSIYDVAADAKTDTLSETCVAIIQGAGFNTAGSSNSGHAHRLFEMALEGVLKVA